MAGRETKLIQQVRSSARRHGLADASVVVGFSGGRDSTVLLASLRPVVRRLTAVHVDHGVRAESADEAARAVAIAAGLGVSCEVKRLDDAAVAGHRHVGLEEALRRERYRVFAAMDCDVVALGHHALDQAESVVMHLLRGSGLRGVAGMREVSMLGVPWWREVERELLVWRPLIGVRPDALDAEIARLGIAPIIDASNEDRAFRRNAVRLDVLPLLESVQPGSIEALVRFAELAGAEDDLLDRMASDVLDGVSDLPVHLVRELDVALQRRVVRKWLLSSTSFLEISYERSIAVMDAVAGNHGGVSIDVGEGFVVVINDGVACVVRGANRR
jgi:tRNA(Ile)-lysidine synthase